MAYIKHEVWIDAPPQRVFELLNTAEAISTWWDEQTQRQTPEGVVLEHSPGPEHGTVGFLVLTSELNLIKWRCISRHPSNVPTSEWTDPVEHGSRYKSELCNAARQDTILSGTGNGPVA